MEIQACMESLEEVREPRRWQKGFRIPNFPNEKILLRKCGVANDLLYSSRNMIAAEEPMSQFNDMFKLLMSLYRDYGAMISEQKKMENGDWFNLADEEVFAFKRKINLWLENADEDQRSCTISERIHSKGSLNPTKLC